MSNLARKILDEFDAKDKETIKNWAEHAYLIKNDEETKKNEKIKRLYKITNENKVIILCLKKIFDKTKKHAWDDRKWSGRLAISGLALGLGTVGGKMAGLASFGFGVGVPIFLLSSAGGALLGTIIDELSNNNKQS